VSGAEQFSQDDTSGEADLSEAALSEDALPQDAGPRPGALWPDDSGQLPDTTRRALLALVRGPYVSYARNGNLWSAILRDEDALRSRLHELFLDLVIDSTALVAYVRNVDAPDADLPKSVRSASLTFLDTALLLVLRQHLVTAVGSDRVIVGKDEIIEQLEVYRERSTDRAGFAKRVSASWGNMKKFGLISDSSTSEDRVEISPVLRLVFGPDEVAAVRAEYRRIANGGRHPDSEPATEHGDNR
jgi:hypothetical protein